MDDEEFCISTMKLLLKLSGITNEAQVDYCINGQEAVDMVEQASSHGLTYKLILTDFSMPVMAGIKSTQLIRQHYTSLGIATDQQPSVIGITGHA